MEDNSYEDDYDLDFYENAINVRETLVANKSSSGNESQTFQQNIANKELQKSKEFYQKNGNGTMPLPERLSYEGVDDPDNIPMHKFRPKNQYFAGTDVATGVKDMNSVLDSEPGYDEDPDSGAMANMFDDLMQYAATNVGKGVLAQQSAGRAGQGAAWKIYQMIHKMGLAAGEGMADLFTPVDLKMDEKKTKKFWEAKRLEDVSELPESIMPHGELEGMAQEMLSYLAPYSALAKSVGMFKAIQQGKYMSAGVRDAVASSILAQGFSPEEGNLSTVLREAGFGEDILQYSDSKATYENDGRWASRVAMAMEETGLTVLPASMALLGMSAYKGMQRSVKSQNQATLSELMEAMPKANLNSKGEPGNKISAQQIKALARVYADDGSTVVDFIGENTGAYTAEVLQKAWDDAIKDKKVWNKAAATYIQGPRDMAAVHAMEGEHVLTALRQGGIPAPSIGIVKDMAELDTYGDWKFIMNHSAFNPEYDQMKNVVAREDMWSSVLGFTGEDTLRGMTKYQTLRSRVGNDPFGEVSMGYFNPHLASSMVHGKAKHLDEIRERRGEYGHGFIEDADGERLQISAQEVNDQIYNMSAGAQELLDDRFAKFTAHIDPDDYEEVFENAPRIDDLLMNITEELADTGVTNVPKDLIKKKISHLIKNERWPDELLKDKKFIDLTKDIMDKSISIPIRYQEAKPQRALRFGPGQDVGAVIAPADADDAVLEELSKMGVQIFKDDGSGLSQLPDSLKFAMPPVMSLLMAEEEEQGDEI